MKQLRGRTAKPPTSMVYTTKNKTTNAATHEIVLCIGKTKHNHLFVKYIHQHYYCVRNAHFPFVCAGIINVGRCVTNGCDVPKMTLINRCQQQNRILYSTLKPHICIDTHSCADSLCVAPWCNRVGDLSQWNAPIIDILDGIICVLFILFWHDFGNENAKVDKHTRKDQTSMH